MGWLIAEKSSTKVASTFLTESAARETASAVVSATGLDERQVRILSPNDGRRIRRSLFGRKVQPESDGIAKTFWRSHVALGALGAVIGGLAWWTLSAHPLIASTPIMSLVAFVGFGITFGAIVAGLLTFRPDQAALFTQLRSKLRAGSWAVIFHPSDREQADAIKTALASTQAEVLTSL